MDDHGGEKMAKMKKASLETCGRPARYIKPKRAAQIRETRKT